MSLRYEMDLVRYRHTLNQFVTELRANKVFLLREEMRLLLRDILRFTAPNSLKQGRNAVRGDMSRLAAPLDPAKIKIPRLAELVRERNVDGILKFTKNLKGQWGGRRLLDANTLGPEHLRARNRYGRVGRSNRNMAFLTDWRRYTTNIQSRVGWTKCGWFRAAQAVGLRLPAWITRHQAYAPSGYQAPTHHHPVIVAVNRSIKIPNYQARYVEPAVRARANSLASELKRIFAGGKSRRGSLAHTAAGQAD